MTIKQFKRRWINSKVEPELFYMPVEKKDEAFTIEIECSKNQRQNIQFYYSIDRLFDLKQHLTDIFSATFTSAYNDAEVQPWYAYQKDVFLQGLFLIINPTYNGTLITPEKFPELFRQDINFDTLTYEELVDKGGLLAHPVIHKTFNIGNEVVIEQFSKQLTIYTDNFNSTINWGDGTTETLNPEVTEKTIKTVMNNEIVEIKYQTILKSKSITHNYTSAGRYVVKVNSNCLIATPYTNNVRKILSWGQNNNIRSLTYIDSNSIKDVLESIPEDCRSLSNVINACHYFHFTKRDPTYLSIGQWQERAINMLHSMPYLINAYYMFGGNSAYDSSSKSKYYYKFFDNIPDKLFCKNKYLINADYCFYNPFSKGTQSVGNQIFANLPFLSSADYSFYDNYNNNDAQLIDNITEKNFIGDGVFENDWLLQSCNTAFFGIYVQSYGDYIFKNCYSLTFVTHMGYYMYSLRTLGKGIFENCYNLKYVTYLCLDCPLLESIGEDMFKGCKNLVCLEECFRKMYSLTAFPNKMFYDLQWTDERKYGFHFGSITDLLLGYDDFDENGNIIIKSYHNPWFKEIANKWNFYTLPTLYFPKEFINPQFIEDCAIHGQNVTLDVYNANNYYIDKNGTIMQRNVFSGYAPDCWNYNNYGLWNSVQNPNNEILPPYNYYGQSNYLRLYGYERRNDNEFICENEWINYNEIPTEHLNKYT